MSSSFQRQIGAILVLSICISAAAWRTTLKNHLLLCVILLLPIVFISQTTVFLLFAIFCQPHLSRLKHLPIPEQKSLFERILKEPNAFHFGRWINDVPNKGMIRYFGTLNEERVLITSPHAVREILGTKAYLFEKQYSQKAHLRRLSGDSLVVVEGATHKVHRKAMEAAFWVRKVDSNFLPIFWRKALHLNKLLSCELVDDHHLGEIKQLNSPTAVVLDNLISRAVFDIMGEAAFGTDFQCLDQPEVSYNPTTGWREAFKPSAQTRNRMILALLLPTCVVDKLPIKFNRCMGQSITAVVRQARNTIRCKKQAKEAASVLKAMPAVMNSHPELDMGVTKGGDLIDHCLSVAHFTDQDICNQYMMLHSGGTHSTITAVKSVVWFLAQQQHRHVQTRLREEIREKIPQSTIITSMNHLDFKRLSYLNAVREEVLRLQSAFSNLGRVAIQDVEVCGEIIPAGTTISISPWAMHRSREVWGDDADEFKPERWLSQESTSKVVPTANGSHITFGFGPRSCIARKFAEAELNCIIAALFGRFDFAFPDGVEPPKITHQVTVALRSPLEVQAKLVDGWL